MSIYLGSNLITYEGGNGGYMINGRLIATDSYSINLGQTNYSSITPSTTSQSLTLPATTYSASSTSPHIFRIGEDYDGTVINRDLHDYVCFVTAKIELNYGNNNVTSIIHPVRQVYRRDYHAGKYIQSINSSTGKLTTSVSKSYSYITTVTPVLYQKADGTYAITSGSYGVYPSLSPAISTSNSKDYIYTNGSIGVRISDTFAPLDALTAINPTNTIITF